MPVQFCYRSRAVKQGFEMEHDQRGVRRTAASAEVATRFEGALTAFLAQRPDAGKLALDTIAADPGMVAAQGLAGFMNLLAARGDLAATAGLHLTAARRALALQGGSPEEAALVTALGAWHDDGDMTRSANILDDALSENPRDLLLLRLSHAVRFMFGDAIGMRRTIEAALPAWSADDPGYAYLLGCHAFALGETGAFAEGERVGKRAVTQEPADLWGAHAVAHAMGAQSRPREGVAWIAWLEPHLACGGSFVRHIQWHRALCHLRLGEPDQALELYDRRVRDTPSGEVRDILNAASLLWRLEAAGVAIPASRWDELADIAERRIGEHAWTFADLHYVLCLASARRGAASEAMLSSIARFGEAGGGTQADVHAAVGLTAARAVAQAISGEHQEAARAFAAVRTGLRSVGGSNAQRDLLRAMQVRSERACQAGSGAAAR